MSLGKGKIVVRNELAAILGYDPKTILVWQKAGMPYRPGQGGGESNEYNTAEVIRWMIAREAHGGLSLETEKAKLAAAQTRAAELKSAKLEGKLIEVETACFIAQKAAFEIRAKIMACSLPEDEKERVLDEIHRLGEVDFTKQEQDEEEQGEGDEEGSEEPTE